VSKSSLSKSTVTESRAAIGAPFSLDAAMTRAQAIARVGAFLARHGVEEPARDARALLLAAARLQLVELTVSPETPLGVAAARRLAQYAARRAAREPASRITGERGFWTLDLLVYKNVLDPRADTETLIETALDLLRDRRDEALSILDLGSGSGALLCALLSEFTQARGVAVDLSRDACAASAANLARCGLASRASVVRGRWAEAVNARFDVIVSNPPYIRRADIGGLDPEVRLHDPALALDGGEDGLDCYRELTRELPRLLDGNGVALFETGAGQAAGVAAILMAQGLALDGIGRDLGGHERVVAARLAPGYS
jgi:release factor glutamine methyltransferase